MDVAKRRPPLTGVRVVELAGLAPGPFAGMVLGDWGAEVIRVDRSGGPKNPVPNQDTLARGKRSVTLDLKAARDRTVFRKLVRSADVLIDPYRPGVLERLDLGPEQLLADNPRLIYARMTGFGQGGVKEVELAAGHDINYLAQSGVLASLRQPGQLPQPPVNILGDFAGGGMMCAFGVVAALYERTRSGRGQVVDAAMVDGAAYLSTFVLDLIAKGHISQAAPGTGVLDGGAPFYATYECKDGAFFTVGAIEPAFFKAFTSCLGVKVGSQFNKAKWPEMRKVFADKFKEKTQAEWTEVFRGHDACAWPVLTYAQAVADPHNVQRKMWMEGDAPLPQPAPAPKLSHSPAITRARPLPEVGQHNEMLAKL